MSFSPADLNLYLRVSGESYPDTPQKMMEIAPRVHNFTRNFGRGTQTQQEPSVIRQVAGDLGKLAILGAVGGTAYGLGQVLNAKDSISPPNDPPNGNNPPNDPPNDPPNGNNPPNFTPPTKDERQQEHIVDWYDNPDTRLDQVIALDDAHEERFGLPGAIQGNQIGTMGSLQIPNLYDAVLAHDFGSPQDDGFVEIPVKDPRSNRFESIRQQEEDRADLDYTMSGGAALDQGFEDAIGRDDYHEERFGIQGSPQSSAIVEGPETVIQPSNEPKGFLDAFSQEVKDFDHNIPWGERVDQAASSDSALGAAGIMAGTVAEKGAKDVGTRVKKIVTGVPQSINTVKNIASDIGETVTREIINSSIIPDNKMQPSKWAEAARLAAGFPALGGSGGVEIGNESDLSDNAQSDDLHQQNEQITPAGINRQTSGLGSDPVEGEMQTIAQAVDDLAASFGKGLAHLSPEERVDIARKMIEDDLRKDGYKGPINFG